MAAAQRAASTERTNEHARLTVLMSATQDEETHDHVCVCVCVWLSNIAFDQGATAALTFIITFECWLFVVIIFECCLEHQQKIALQTSE